MTTRHRRNLQIGKERKKRKVRNRKYDQKLMLTAYRKSCCTYRLDSMKVMFTIPPKRPLRVLDPPPWVETQVSLVSPHWLCCARPSANGDFNRYNHRNGGKNVSIEKFELDSWLAGLGLGSTFVGLSLLWLGWGGKLIGKKETRWYLLSAILASNRNDGLSGWEGPSIGHKETTDGEAMIQAKDKDYRASKLWKLRVLLDERFLVIGNPRAFCVAFKTFILIRL